MKNVLARFRAFFQPQCDGWWCEKENKVNKKGEMCDHCKVKSKEQSERMEYDATHTTTENRYQDLPLGTEVLVNGALGIITGYRYVGDGLYFSRLTTYYEIEIEKGKKVIASMVNVRKVHLDSGFISA